MNIRIKDLLRKYNATLVYNDDLHKKGFNIPINSTSNIIVVNSDLTDEEIEQVILHELGHSANDDEVIGSYKNYLVPRFKMESKANDFMLRELLEKYILTTNTDHNHVAVSEQPPVYDFAVQVNGDSMEPMFADEQIIYVKRVEGTEEVRDNQIVIAELNGNAYVKKIAFDGDRNSCRLISLNKKYADIIVKSDDSFKVIGVVVI